MYDRSRKVPPPAGPLNGGKLKQLASGVALALVALSQASQSAPPDVHADRSVTFPGYDTRLETRLFRRPIRTDPTCNRKLCCLSR